ncbi:MAG: (Fe-S)-binding protein [Aquificae bacterium]|nr:(Fe-S)-binding protein [Aquificota bacterium]
MNLTVEHKENISQEDINIFYEFCKKSVDNAEIASYLEACVRCGLCFEACHFAVSENISGKMKPELVPAYKADLLRDIYKENYTILGKIKKALGFGVKITPEKIKEQKFLVYDTCTNCDRCARVCPMGIETPKLTSIVRGALSLAGQAPEDLVNATNAALETGSPFGIDKESYLQILTDISKNHDIQIPIDKNNSEYLYITTSLDLTQFQDSIAKAAKIFNRANLNWTMSSIAREGSNMGVFLGRKDIQKELGKRILEGAKKVGAKYLIYAECGHGYQFLRYVAPNLFEDWDFEVILVDELAYKLINERKINLNKKVLKQTATLHYSCQIGRRGGLTQIPRELTKMVSENYVDSIDKAEKNLCCGGGGGVVINEEAHEHMQKAFLLKIEQYDKVGAKNIVTYCANCQFVLDMNSKEYNRDYQIKSLIELIAEAMED